MNEKAEHSQLSNKELLVHNIHSLVRPSDMRYWTKAFDWDNLIRSANKEVFGNHTLRKLQLEAINATMAGYPVFLSLPTGGGKSLCFQLPAVCSKGVTIVVSPLIALIYDQVAKLKSLGIPTAMLSSALTTEEYQQVVAGTNGTSIHVHRLKTACCAVQTSLCYT